MSKASAKMKKQWEKIQKEYQESDTMRQSIMEITSTEVGQQILDQARQNWLDQGFKTAPFDFIFEDGNS